MFDVNCICYVKELRIFAINVYDYKRHNELGSRTRFERIENTFIDAYFGTFRMLSTDHLFFTELSYFRSVTHSFLHEKMGAMSKSDPQSGHSFSIGNGRKGTLSFKKITRSLSANARKEQYLSIRHDPPPNVPIKIGSQYYNGALSEYDYQEVKLIDSCIGKALNLYDTRVTHIENVKELLANWNVANWITELEDFEYDNLLTEDNIPSYTF
ncbi:MAG TPA: hypothetical protein PK528_10240 [Syntrophorhabdus sp.]|mgnify:CR=1 FL=1|jgi:hypothetical protein|nr:hypothetical protein [Deltaproteobacteria bacterium]HPW69426.1 hypothetical protein [Deltaproteobacteria bacterium]HQO63980.1 hypothetical protein [Syntrophorhabdus sp.]